MSKLDDIQNLIHQLSKEEITRLREWFDEFEGDMWDQELDKNVQEKKLNVKASAAKKDFSEGKSKTV